MDCYIGEIRMFAGTRVPSGWHFCDGSLLNISDYQPLFSLIGATYGGDGVNKFALPDMLGRVPIGQGQGTNLSVRSLGQSGGAESVTLTTNETPAHSHSVNVTEKAGTTNILGNTVVWAKSETIKTYATVSATSSVDSTMNAAAFSTVGGDFPHNNIMPSIAVNFIISLNGLYPSFN